MIAPSHQPKEGGESFIKKVFDHHRHEHGSEGENAMNKPQDGGSGLRAELKKEEKGFKQYLKEDEQLEKEGRTYGGLM